MRLDVQGCPPPVSPPHRRPEPQEDPVPVAPELEPYCTPPGQGAAEMPELSVLREGFEAMASMWDADPSPLRSVEPRTIPGPAGEIPVVVYTPESGPDDGPLPVLLFLHGGGFFLGSPHSHGPVARELAARSGRLVVSVDYRLTPEHEFPAAVDDCYAALLWVAEHAPEFGGDASRLAVAGDSAGGNLSAVLTLRARDEGGPAITAQALIYPVTDSGLDTVSMHDNAEGYMLTAASMGWMWGMYVPDESRRSDAYASPLQAGDHAGLPPAVVITAEYDPLRDEGEAYAAKLAAAGVPVQQVRFDGMIHGFVQMINVTPRATEAIDLVAAHLRANA
jgi:acetyl esterase